jgi:L-threonylcarbamoyladenylate synthase
MMMRPATGDAIAQAAHLLRKGGLVAFPTETVYGLGADATDGLAAARIFEAKGRPRFNPLIVHIPDLATARQFAEVDERASRLAELFWPGALTLVLPLRGDANLSGLVTAGLQTVALRAPSHPVARQLLREAGLPIAAPSANRSGHVSPTRAAHVEADLGSAVDFILDAGATPAGVESSIVGLAGEQAMLLRPGAVPAEEIEAALGAALLRGAGEDAILAPGQLPSHYAPRAALRLNAGAAGPGEVLLAFGPEAPENALNLSRTGDLREAAANLFAFLRQLDASGARAIAAMPVPRHGLGEAINDRLARAAAPRISCRTREAS